MSSRRGALPSKQQFSDQVEKTFRISAPDGTAAEVTLVEFKDIADTEAVETFSLLFQVPANLAVAQGTYRAENDEMEPMDIFLVPIRRNGEGLYLEAIFNRLKQKGAGA